MRFLALAAILFSTSLTSFSQDNAQKIYDTERSFEKAVAEKGIKVGFIEFLSPFGVMFRPGVVNGREWWSSRPESAAALTWNPIKIEVSSNGASATASGIRFTVRKARTKRTSFTDTTSRCGPVSRVVSIVPLDAGINHPKPTKLEPDWKPSEAVTAEANETRSFAGDSSISFYRLAERRGLKEAYKRHAADDIYLLRDDHQPFVGRDAAVDFLDSLEGSIKFVKRRSFIEAGDLAYVYSTYTMFDKKGIETGKGNFIQIWKLRSGRWQIAADLFLPMPEKS